MIEPTPAAMALRALRAPDQRNMGRVADGMGPDAVRLLADLDACASSYRAWSPILVPGLLQIERYAFAAIKSRTPSLASEEIGVRVRQRQRRSNAFLARWAGRQGTFAWFLVGEAAVTQPLRNDFTHGMQLQHLLNVSQDYGSVVIQVIPEDAPACSVEPFSMFALNDGSRVGMLESLIGGWYTLVPEDVSRLHSAFSNLMDAAYTPADSREIIKEVLDSCWGHTTVPSSGNPPTLTPRTASSSPAPPPALSE